MKEEMEYSVSGSPCPLVHWLRDTLVTRISPFPLRQIRPYEGENTQHFSHDIPNIVVSLGINVLNLRKKNQFCPQLPSSALE
jgi:hypothetical protein